MWVTWKHLSNQITQPLPFETKVELFEEAALGWQLHIADLVANGGTSFGENGNRTGQAVRAIRHSGFAVLQICLSYFETIGRYTGATGGSGQAFRAGVRHVLQSAPANDALLDALYEDARCGLYHNKRTARVVLAQPAGGEAIAFDTANHRVIVSPERLPPMLKDHLKQYADDLRDPVNTTLRTKFETQFNADSGIT